MNLTPPENTMRQQNNFRIMDTVKMYSTNKNNEKNNDVYEYAYIYSGSDTFGIGGNAWVIDHITDRTVQITGYHTMDTVKHDVPIGIRASQQLISQMEKLYSSEQMKLPFLTRMQTHSSQFHRCWKMVLKYKTNPKDMEVYHILLVKILYFL